MHIESVRGGGTTVPIWLPASVPPMEEDE